MQMQMQSKVIKEGGYGCALSPPLPCAKSKRDLGKREVGKLIRMKNAKIELSISTLVKSIPGWSKFYVVQERDDCTSKDMALLRNTYEDECKVFEESEDTELMQLLSPFAGSPLSGLGLTPSFDYMENFEHILEAVALLNQQGICHFDLHENNVLIDTKGDFRIIDFGAAFLGDQTDEACVKRHVYVFSPDFPPLPPEVIMHHGISNDLTMKETLEQIMKKKVSFKVIQNILGIRVEEQESQIRNFWAKDDTWKGDSWVAFYKKYWRTWDSWAVGVLFLDLLKKCMLMPSFIEKTWTLHGAAIKEVLRGCLDSNPLTRLTAMQALRTLREARRDARRVTLASKLASPSSPSPVE
jgi:serine/threonine protein kinase